MSEAAAANVDGVFEASRDCFEETLVWLGSAATVLTHGELEAQLDCRGRELLRRMCQAHFDIRARAETRIDAVRDGENVVHGTVETGHRRSLMTIFGEVDVERYAYRHRGHTNLYPADAVLNLPVELHSHGLRRTAAIEVSRGSFDEARRAIERVTGQHVAKRQIEALAARAATDIESFYACRPPPQAAVTDLLVISADGKGIVMRPDSLRPATAKAAGTATNKLNCRLSKGERRYRKRLAEVGAVYDLTPVARTATDIIGPKGDNTKPTAPHATAKWVTASVVDDAATVIAKIFDEAERRDPHHLRAWVALVDGNNHQIQRIETEANTRHINVPIVVDLIHVLEYLWGAAWCFFNEGDTAAQSWVRDKTLAVLEGHARDVATGIRRRATTTRLPKQKRIKADACATYLTNKADYLDYPTALTNGWPIASGVIEGTCRYLVADRMDITGARWSVNGAETILKLRAIRANNDLDEYWTHHTQNEQHRNHDTRYANNTLPTAA